MSPAQSYAKVRAHTEQICKPLKVEDYAMQPFSFGSPAKWHLAHTSWFFETFILKEHVKDYQLYDEKFPFYFNSYYQTLGERQQRDQRAWLTRPTVEEVYNYRKHVDQAMVEFLSGDIHEDVLGLLTIGLQHEQQHQELLLTDLKIGFSVQPFDVIYDTHPLIPDGEVLSNSSQEWIKVEAGLYEIGHDGNGFAFDNEYTRHKVHLEAYQISNTPVTTGEFIEFIEAGGYEHFQYWHDEAWHWLQDEGIQLPLYWEKDGDKYSQFTLSGRIPITGKEIMQHVSFYEAAAFAAWKGCRLPTEAEWEAANHLFSWGVVWEWTNSAYLPYPGYTKPEGAVGEYNGKFMVNQMVLRGSSIATSQNHSRPTYRNFFHTNLRWQFSGIRLAKDA